MRSLFSLLLSFFLLIASKGQAQSPEMADGMRSEGKIYVVVAIVLVVLLGLLAYLFVIDRKVTRLEKSSGRN